GLAALQGPARGRQRIIHLRASWGDADNDELCVPIDVVEWRVVGPDFFVSAGGNQEVGFRCRLFSKVGGGVTGDGTGIAVERGHDGSLCAYSALSVSMTCSS